MTRRSRVTIMGVAFVVAILRIVPASRALDTGLLQHKLNVNVTLPTLEEAIGPEAAQAAARSHIQSVLQRPAGRRTPMSDYWSDYRQVLEKYPEVSKALPVFTSKEVGPRRVARYLVGLQLRDEVGGFIAVDPRDRSIQSKLMWTPDLEPLWRVPAAAWEQAAAANDVPGLSELMPPYSQFTTGVPVRPQDFQLVDGVTDLPLKTQEERAATVEEFNQVHGTALKLELGHTEGRRTATSKCLSVAASYAADWWAVRTGHGLGSYRNPVGGQKEYGVNPRLLENLYFKRAKEEASLAGRVVQKLGDLLGTGLYALSQFKLVGKDRVTGEPIPYSPRGYARVLNECAAGAVPDNLAPSLAHEEVSDNHFNMDRAPVLVVLDRSFMARATLKRDERRYGDEEDDDGAAFQVSPWNQKTMSSAERTEALKAALASWGPLLGQHMKRSGDGAPSTGLLATGVHACLIVGHGTWKGEEVFVYRETFGDCEPSYLEDSFVGPSYRAMPADYFWQAIGFPHHLDLKLSVAADGAGLTADVKVTTDRGRDPVDADAVLVFVDGAPVAADVEQTGTGAYRVRLPSAGAARRIEVRAAKKYFADAARRNGFGVAAELRGTSWEVLAEPLEPTTVEVTTRR